jgi:hypothetical protein
MVSPSTVHSKIHLKRSPHPSNSNFIFGGSLKRLNASNVFVFVLVWLIVLDEMLGVSWIDKWACGIFYFVGAVSRRVAGFFLFW